MTLIGTLPKINKQGAPFDWADTETNDAAIRDVVDGNLDTSNLSASAGITSGQLAGSIAWSKLLGTAVQAQLGVNDGTTVSRGKSIIATSESRTNVAYGTLTTPDQVTGIVLPTDGLIAVAYSALWQSSTSSAGNAAIFLGANQVVLPDLSGAPSATSPSSNGAGVDSFLSAGPAGLVTGNVTVSETGALTTGQFAATAVGASGVYQGGPAYIWAAAGTYTVSVQFKAAAGSVTAKERKLWVWTIGF